MTVEGPLRQPYVVRYGRIRSRQLELNVAEHCNLSCRGCTHLSPVLPRRLVDVADVSRDLSLLARHLSVDRVKLLGGEPLLHPDIVAIVAAARDSGVGKSVCVVTNGVLLPRMGDAFWEAVDRVDVSFYPGKELADAERDLCARRAEAAGVRIRFKPMGAFRESYSEVGTEDEQLVRRIYDSCRLAHSWRCHTVADGTFYKCPPAYFLPKLGHANGEDGLHIEDAPDFGRRLLAYLESPEPLDACRRCLGSSGLRFPHRQTRRSEFRSLQARPSEELVDPRELVSLAAS